MSFLEKILHIPHFAMPWQSSPLSNHLFCGEIPPDVQPNPPMAVHVLVSCCWLPGRGAWPHLVHPLFRFLHMDQLTCLMVHKTVPAPLASSQNTVLGYPVGYTGGGRLAEQSSLPVIIVDIFWKSPIFIWESIWIQLKIILMTRFKSEARYWRIKMYHWMQSLTGFAMIRFQDI